MQKLIITLFLIVLGSLAVFAQKDDGEYRKGNSGNLNLELERRCYNSTSSFAEFKRCVEERKLPTCPKDWELKDLGGVYRDFPCRDERKDFWEERRFAPIDRFKL